MRTKKISIIIPNYNNEKYILDCLNSILNQRYPNKEIIIVDDGSTDKSLKIINDFILSHAKEKIYLICQNNLNASIARNEGIKKATGDYVMFFDSDDILEEGALEAFVDAYNNNPTADLVIGNFVFVDERNKEIDNTCYTDETISLNKMKNFGRLADIGPAPMNKMYRLDIIKNNNIIWGNVRIAQDLNFYLKYLLFCNNVILLDKFIYRYRQTSNSISRSYDFRIFDIVNSFSDVERFYNNNDGARLYKKYLPFQMLKHYDIQMTKQVFYKERKTRNLIVKFFALNKRTIDFSIYDKSDVLYKNISRKFWLKTHLRFLFTSNLYSKYKRKRIKK